MLDNVGNGPNGYAVHEDSYAMENEYHNNHVSMQMMPPQYSQQHMSSSYGTQGVYPDGDWNVDTRSQYGWSRPNRHQNGWSSNTGYYSHHASGGAPYPGGMSGPMMATGRMSSNNMMMNAGYTTYAAGPGRVSRMPTYGGFQSESYDDFANGMHNGRQKVEWKNL